ncbi:MAG: 30S ribosomal protein S5 [Armatimonadota bacterium]
MARIDPSTLENLQERIVKTNKVTKTHKGGRTPSWNALVVVGDGEGHVGVALGKARAIPEAIRKGAEAAKKSLIRVPLIDRTIPHEVVCSEGATTVVLRPAAPGTGVVAGAAAREILVAAGVHDVLAKTLGSHNAINTAWATMKALKMLKRADLVAESRGIPIEKLGKRWAAIAGASSEEDHVPEA